MEIYLLFQIFVFLFSIGYRICQPVSKAPVEVIIEEAPKPPVPLLDQCLTQIKESPDTDVTKLSQYKLGLLHGCMNSKFGHLEKDTRVLEDEKNFLEQQVMEVEMREMPLMPEIPTYI
ncbi:uncharacterized protein LOC135847984 isoform X1 [Planococcus citri]|uniref:uncharacterized protein LOC135847984 isoform X1 n=1 Tax=Planococcus citri TaxID=170843 RepID=UPI0031F8B67D